MQTSNLHPNIKPLQHLAMLRECNYVVPVIILFVAGRNVTAGQFMMIQAMFMVVMLFAEPLISPLADRYGRKRSIMAGAFLWVLGHVIMLGSYSWQGFALSEVVFGIGIACMGSSNKALLYESFLSINREDAHYAASTRQSSLASYASAFGMLAGGLLYAAMPGLPVVATIIGSSLMLPVAWRLQEVTHRVSIADKVLSYRQMWHHAWVSLSSPHIRWLAIMPGIISGSTITLFWSVQPTYTHAGVSAALTSFLLAVLCILRGLFTKQCPRLVENLTGRQCFGLCVAALAVSYSTMALLPWWVAYLPFVAGAGCAYALASTVGNELLNRHLPSEVRSTALGASALVGRGMSILTLAAGGLLEPLIGLPATLLVVGAVAVTLGLAGLLHLPRENLHQPARKAA